MKNFKNKIAAAFLAVAMICSFTAITAYADPGDSGEVVVVPGDGGDNTGGDTPGDNTGGDNTGGDIPSSDNTGGDNTGGDTPGDNTGGDNTGGDNSGDNTDNNTPPDDNNDYNNGGDTGDNSGSGTDYDYNYYNNFDNQGYDSSANSIPQEQSIYDPGMSFNEFEQATDYQSATASTEKTVDMYNSNGSDNTTLDANDWKDLELNLSKVSSDGTGDFSFIKNNNSDKDSNMTMLLFIFGIIFVVGSLALMAYIVISGVKGRKLPAAGGRYYKKSGTAKGKAATAKSKAGSDKRVKRTPYVYDSSKAQTEQIDISQYSDNF
ncbi:hypothetical protein ACTQ3M_02895 [Oscillospiraceae bacterium LCP25S3_E10]|nr:hypothetical protein [Ruminococcus sp.]MDD6447740.1 hypothetical protein [Ruminococcus sp.]